MAVPTFNGTVSSITYASRTSVAGTPISVPASVVDGERLFCAFFILNDPLPTVTPPAGWTQVGSSIAVADAGSNDGGFTLWTRVASSEPASYTWGHSVTSNTQAMMWRTSACLVDVVSSRGDSSVASAIRTWDSITTTGADRLLYAVGFDWANNATGETPPTGFTEDLDNTLLYLAHATQASAGASGDKTNTCNSNSGSNPRGGFLVAVYEAGGGGGGGKPVKVWNGSSWVTKPLKVWNGSSWVTKPAKVWNGSAWV